MKVSDFDYTLPEALIAQQPSQRRDYSRLLVLDRATGTRSHRHFYDLPSLLQSGDLLVLNDTKVIPARLFAHKPTGGQVEVLLLHPVDDRRWTCLVKPGRRVHPGTELYFSGDLRGEVVEEGDKGMRTILFSLGGDEFQRKLDEIGEMPLPPYIHEKPRDPQRYQTVYAARSGAVAAPTAGLHFTAELFAKLDAVGVERTQLTLHVGIGTFRPVDVEDVQQHEMHSEYYEIGQDAADAINRAKAQARRIIAVGTTAVRVLETASTADGRIQAGHGWTDIFIYPGYTFKAVDALVTNFHLPRSTVLMLVSALAGRENILAAYREAVAREYRFFSFGDSMLIL